MKLFWVLPTGYMCVPLFRYGVSIETKGHFMKKLMVAAAIVAVSAPALAADLPAGTYTKAPAAVAPAYDWSGFYVGVNAGGAWSRADLGTSTIFDPAHRAGYFGDAVSTNLFNSVGNQRANTSGFIGGAQAGFNWQVDNFVAGLETDFQSFHQHGSSTATAIYPTGGAAGVPFTISQSFSTDWLWTLRPRLGFAANSWLIYATGGLAVTHLKGNFLFVDGFADTEAASMSETRTGWTVGGGVEYALLNGWSLKAEYLHLDFGTEEMTTHNLLDSGTFPVPGQPFTHRVKLTSDIARIGLNYNFGTPGTVRH
ncbi:outer membrane protein [Bradyrhizobium erythrophlei]|nr:outer membrane protein [Bradyrhizobium erythrophlei]